MAHQIREIEEKSLNITPTFCHLHLEPSQCLEPRNPWDQIKNWVAQSPVPSKQKMLQPAMDISTPSWSFFVLQKTGQQWNLKSYNNPKWYKLWKHKQAYRTLVFRDFSRSWIFSDLTTLGTSCCTTCNGLHQSIKKTHFNIKIKTSWPISHT